MAEAGSSDVREDDLVAVGCPGWLYGPLGRGSRGCEVSQLSLPGAVRVDGEQVRGVVWKAGYSSRAGLIDDDVSPGIPVGRSCECFERRQVAQSAGAVRADGADARPSDGSRRCLRVDEARELEDKLPSVR